jgi:hypothetical protein
VCEIFWDSKYSDGATRQIRKGTDRNHEAERYTKNNSSFTLSAQPYCKKRRRKHSNYKVVLGGLVVIVLTTGSKVRCSNPSEECGFLRAIKIRRATSFGGEVTASAPCHKILRYVKNLRGMKNIFVSNINGHY